MKHTVLPSRRRFALLVSLVLVLAACEPPPRVRSANDALTFRAPGAAATHYARSGRGPIAIVGDKPSSALSAAIETTARLQQVKLVGDARLAALAAFCADVLPPGQRTLPPAVLEWAAGHLGLYDVAPEVIVIDVPRADATAAVSNALAPRLIEHEHTHYGAVLVARDSASLLVVALADRKVDLEDVPRVVSVSEPIRVRGRLAAHFENPRVDLTVNTQAGVSRKLLSAGGGPDFDVQIPTPSKGSYRIEILGDGELGNVVLAQLTVYVGVAVPSTFTLQQHGGVLDLAGLRRDLLALINAERSRAGVAPLQADPVLDRLALDHSVDMGDHGFLSHVSVRTGAPADRVARAGLGQGLVLENIARGGDAPSLHAAALAQAGSRSNLLHADVTHVGLGVVEQSSAHGSSLLATELFVQESRVLDPSAAAPELLAMLNRTRSTRGARALSFDSELAGVAQAAAQDFVNSPGVTEQHVIDAANEKLQRFSLSYRRVAAVLVLARSLEDARSLEPALDATVRSVGIGVAQGTRSDRGGHVLVIALVLGWTR